MDVQLTQMRLMYLHYDCGMWYILRDGDGNFAMIDGGMGEYTEADRVMKLLKETTDKPNIKYWFFSHPHVDHFNGFIDFCNKFKGEFTLEHLVYDWPPECVVCSDLTEFNKVLERDKFNVITPKNDDVFKMAGVNIKVLATWHDLPEINETTYVNNCSTILSVETEKQRAIFPGDDCGPLSEILFEKYGKKLKADFLQLSHHGYWGGSVNFYKAVNPQILLMPAPAYTLPFSKNIEQNKVLFESENLKYIADGSRNIDTFNLTNPQNLPEREKKDRFIEDYSAPEMFDRNIAFLTNGISKFDLKGKIEQLPKGCRITTQSNGVVQLADKADFPDCKDYLLKIDGNFESGNIYLIWNCPAPCAWEPEKFLHLNFAYEKDFSLTIITDSKNGTAEFTFNGEKSTLPYEYVAEKGLYIAIVAGTLTVKKTEIVKIG